MDDGYEAKRQWMVHAAIQSRGISDSLVLNAMRTVPRHEFVPPELAEFAYDDTPLPIGEGQTISQPYVVALMVEALRLKSNDRVLEIGTGSGYAAAIVSRIATEVYTVERHEALARLAQSRFAKLGYQNVHVLHGDGTLGWSEHAPYDAIVVTAGGPGLPEPLLWQLAKKGRLVIPVGAPDEQMLLRVTREPGGKLRRESLGGVRFVPLIGRAGWSANPGRPVPGSAPPSGESAAVSRLIEECADRFDDIETAEVGRLMEQVGDARLVLLGEATHGTSEFYRMRSRLTRELILRRSFNILAVEADWPDAARVDRYVRHLPASKYRWKTFSRFPTWMWRNEEVRELVEWLRAYNAEVRDAERRASFHGLDLYSLHVSAAAVTGYLEHVDPGAAKVARQRYGCLTPWESDPGTYGRAAVTGRYRACEGEVVQMLRDLFVRRAEYAARDGERFLDAFQNARLVANAERYYRVMYYGARESWNLRDQHMFDTLEMLLASKGPDSRAVVWAHNSHLGDAAATEMGARGEHNLGHLCRQKYRDDAFLVGFGTDRGTVAAATDWGGPMEVKAIRPAHKWSYEHLCHQADIPAFLLSLRYPVREVLRDELFPSRLERAIGVIYHPETELRSHYFQACLPEQFDSYVWFDQTDAVAPLSAEAAAVAAETYPFA
jgi:protein-L-isoaspartate(D-aspartate) O-methyltransferase